MYFDIFLWKMSMKKNAVIWTLCLLTKNEYCLVGFHEFFWLEMKVF